jgi:hypothetical protein
MQKVEINLQNGKTATQERLAVANSVALLMKSE